MAISRPVLLALLGALLFGATVLAVQSARSGSDSDAVPAAIETEAAQPTGQPPANSTPQQTLQQAFDLGSVQTNIVIVRIDRGQPGFAAAATAKLVTECAARKVKVHAMAPTAIRCVTHKDVDAEDIRRAVDAFRELTARW